MAGLILLWICTAALAFTGAGLVKTHALKRQLIDIPNTRSSHDQPMPRGGGLAIVIAFYASALLALLLDAIPPYLFIALCAGLVVAGAGFADDHKQLSPRARLAYHFVAAFLAIGWLDAWSILDLGFMAVHWGIIGSIVALFGLVWLTNLFNFMDGIDGIAAAETIFVTTAMCAFTSQFVAPMLLAAAALGFLCLNWPPARLFMGDVGSGFLGFVIGVLALHAITSEAVAPWPFLILVGIFVTDATLTLLRRTISGEKIWLAHRSHAYQWAARRYGSHRPVLLGVISINVCWLLPCAYAAFIFPQWALLITLIAYVPLIALAWHFHAGVMEVAHA
ncbi:MAG: MraY family glycosyltransferase [Parvibaculaceae bacterium]